MNNSLKNKTVLLTRSENPFEFDTDLDGENGPRIILFPTIKIVEIENSPDVFKSLELLNSFDFILLTSVNAADIFLKKISRSQITAGMIKVPVAVVGSKTRTFCEQNGLKVSFLPEKNFSATGLIEELRKNNLSGKKILLPCSKLSAVELPEGLKSSGAKVEVIHTYDVVLPEKSDTAEAEILLKKYAPHVYMFTSPSTFRNFAEILSISNVEEYFRDKIVAAIGKTTKKEIENHGVKVQIVPDIFTIRDMFKTAEEYFSTHNL